MDGLTNNLRVLETRAIPNEAAASPQAPSAFQGNFKTALDQALHRQQPVHFSKHAHMRLNARQLQLTVEQMSRIEEGVNKANAKGIRDSLVLIDDVALVVNVQSKTVITALGREQENIFSNIDGAVIV